MLSSLSCFGMGAEQGTTARVMPEGWAEGDPSLLTSYTGTFKSTVWCRILGRMISGHAQGSTSPSIPSTQNRSGNPTFNLQAVKFYSPSYSERTGLQDCRSKVVTNVISREQSTQDGSSHYLQPANSREAFLERGSLYSLCNGEERSCHGCKLSVTGGFFIYAS